jgi:hypothetical protein
MVLSTRVFRLEISCGKDKHTVRINQARLKVLRSKFDHPAVVEAQPLGDRGACDGGGFRTRPQQRDVIGLQGLARAVILNLTP